jgi:hypothetical protein
MARPPGHRDPLRAGLYRTLRGDGFYIDPVKWAKAAADGDLVGECRRKGCAGYLVADDDPSDNQPAGRRDYTAHCLFCDAEVVAPGGRILHKSGLHAEAATFWAVRPARLKANPGQEATT